MVNLDATPTEQLMMLKQVTRLTGAIHEAQAMQLRILPKVYFTADTKAKASVKVMEEGWGTCEYDIEYDKAANLKQVRLRAETLAKDIQTLFGEDWEVTVKVNGKTAYSTKGRKERNPAIAEGTSSARAVRSNPSF